MPHPLTNREDPRSAVIVEYVRRLVLEEEGTVDLTKLREDGANGVVENATRRASSPASAFPSAAASAGAKKSEVPASCGGSTTTEMVEPLIERFVRELIGSRVDLGVSFGECESRPTTLTPLQKEPKLFTVASMEKEIEQKPTKTIKVAAKMPKEVQVHHPEEADTTRAHPGAFFRCTLSSNDLNDSGESKAENTVHCAVKVAIDGILSAVEKKARSETKANAETAREAQMSARVNSEKRIEDESSSKGPSTFKQELDALQARKAENETGFAPRAGPPEDSPPAPVPMTRIKSEEPPPALVPLAA